LLAAAGSLLLLTSAIAGGLKAGDALPDLGGFKLEGTLPDTFKDKVVMLDFWASWCDPCKASFPVMEELQKKYGPQGLVVIAVNVDEKRGDMESFLKSHAATFTIVRDPGQKLVDKAGIATMPSSFLVGRDGKIRHVHAGFKGDETKKKYEQEIEALLKH
jgi:thiol-disulfide isomerase/thioredoxin